jgi:hypothetical protein
VSENAITPSPGLCSALIVSTTFGPMRGYRARGQLWAFVYLAVRQLLGFGILSLRAERSNEIELLALRHEVVVLRRQMVRPNYRPADRALLAALSLWVPKTSSGPVNRMNGLKLWSGSTRSWR